MSPAPSASRPDPAAALLFDLDGTLTDSADGIVASFVHALAAVDVPVPDVEVDTLIVGPPLADTFAALGFDEETTTRALHAYRERYGSVGWRENTVFDGVAELLADLAATGRPLAVATSKNETIARRILEHFGLAAHFAVIAGASDDGTRAHKSDVIAYALRGLGLDPVPHSDGGTPGVVMIGDRVHDVAGAAKYGIPAIAVGWGYATGNEVHDAAWTVESIDTLREVLSV